jgi:hypothetical protein
MKKFQFLCIEKVSVGWWVGVENVGQDLVTTLLGEARASI